ncbi:MULTISPECIES: hypothetical protein [unclassified Bradyrhizobium]|uniref:hypothetical protein n=1 Tax=unclassified Bradyrhizobium TaxID=2631580 RepID=UPI0028EEFB9E|nr:MULTISPECIES: hypothetical protein [unclassified Bradyrhizobium]
MAGSKPGHDDVDAFSKTLTTYAIASADGEGMAWPMPRRFPSSHQIQVHISALDMTSHSRGVICPSVATDTPFETIERARGMPGEGLTHGPPANKKQAAVTTGSAEHPAFPARWF